MALCLSCRFARPGAARTLVGIRCLNQRWHVQLPACKHSLHREDEIRRRRLKWGGDGLGECSTPVARGLARAARAIWEGLNYRMLPRLEHRESRSPHARVGRGRLRSSSPGRHGLARRPARAIVLRDGAREHQERGRHRRRHADESCDHTGQRADGSAPPRLTAGAGTGSRCGRRASGTVVELSAAAAAELSRAEQRRSSHPARPRAGPLTSSPAPGSERPTSSSRTRPAANEPQGRMAAVGWRGCTTRPTAETAAATAAPAAAASAVSRAGLR